MYMATGDSNDGQDELAGRELGNLVTRSALAVLHKRNCYKGSADREHGEVSILYVT